MPMTLKNRFSFEACRLDSIVLEVKRPRKSQQKNQDHSHLQNITKLLKIEQSLTRIKAENITDIQIL